jgi:hypothetical protein
MCTLHPKIRDLTNKLKIYLEASRCGSSLSWVRHAMRDRRSATFGNNYIGFTFPEVPQDIILYGCYSCLVLVFGTRLLEWSMGITSQEQSTMTKPKVGLDSFLQFVAFSFLAFGLAGDSLV